MKKVYCLILTAVLMLSLTACGSAAGATAKDNPKSASPTKDRTTAATDTKDTITETADAEDTVTAADTEDTVTAADAGSIDFDLTQLSSTMVYSEVYNMMMTPDSYIGKTVKMKGPFTVYQNESGDDYYYTVLISDATACCSQGIEFELAGKHDFPADYPEQGAEITVTGEFQIYQEGEYNYCHLVNATLETE